MHIRRNDIVVAIAGRDAGSGKTGKVLHVMHGSGKAIVEGLQLVKKAMRRSQERPQGGIGEKEAPIPVCKLQLFCPTCKKGVRVRVQLEAERKVRKCRKCGHPFDSQETRR